MSNVRSTVSSGGVLTDVAAEKFPLQVLGAAQTVIASIPTDTDATYLMTAKVVGMGDTVEVAYNNLTVNPAGDGTAVATMTLANAPLDPGSVVIEDGQTEVLSAVDEALAGGGPATQFTRTLSLGVSLVAGSVVITDSKHTDIEGETKNPTGDGTPVASFTLNLPFVANESFLITDDQASPETWTLVDNVLTPNAGASTVQGVSATYNASLGTVELTYAGNVSIAQVTVNYTAVDTETWTDDGANGLTPAATGSNVGTTGTINYATRQAVMNYTSAATIISLSADYDYNSLDQVTWTDNGLGALTPAGAAPVAGTSGTINYTTGDVELTYAGNVDLDNAVYDLRALTDSTDSCCYEFVQKVTNRAGVLSLGTLTSIYSSETAGGLGVTTADNGTAVEILITGLANVNMKWNCSVELLTVKVAGA